MLHPPYQTNVTVLYLILFYLFYLYIIKSLNFVGVFLVLMNQSNGVGSYSCIWPVCVFTCWAVVDGVLACSVRPVLCWNGDGSSYLTPWASVMKVACLCGLYSSCRCLLLRLSSFPSLCILTVYLHGSLLLSITVAGFQSCQTLCCLSSTQEDLLHFCGSTVVAFDAQPFLDLVVFWCDLCSAKLVSLFLFSYCIGFLPVMTSGCQVGLLSGIEEPFGSPSLTVLPFSLFEPFILWIHLIVGISGWMWYVWIPSHSQIVELIQHKVPGIVYV